MMADGGAELIKSWRILCLLSVLSIVLPKCGYAKYIEGHLVTREEWAFLGRFCFLSQIGTLKFEFEYPQKDYEPQNILLYFDDPDQWPAVYKTDKTCLEKESVLRVENHQVINLTLNYLWSGCKVFNNSPPSPTYFCNGARQFRSSRERWWFVAVSHCNSPKNCWQKEAVLRPENNQIIYLSAFYSSSGCNVSDGSYYCSGGRRFASSRERWWYVAASRCGGTKGLNLKYKITMTNGNSGNKFFKHFSADEFYILQVDIGFQIVFFIMFVLSIVCGVILRSRQLFHTTYKIYMFSLFCQVFYLLITCIAYGKYAADGRDNLGLKTFGRVFEAISTLSFLLLLILMGKGYTITRGRLSNSGSIKIAVFMTLYCITYALLFIYEAAFFDPGEVLYLYESPPGYGLIALRLLSWIWFCYAVFFTLKHFPEKSSFYYPFFIFYTIWFWAGPSMLLIANFVLDKWVREKVANGVLLTIQTVGMLYFLFLTRPTAANKNFPYHVRTSQIGIMANPQGQLNGGVQLSPSSENDSFARYAYAPSEPPPPYASAAASNFTELFTVSQTRTTKDPLNAEMFPHQKTGDNPFVVSR